MRTLTILVMCLVMVACSTVKPALVVVDSAPTVKQSTVADKIEAPKDIVDAPAAAQAQTIQPSIFFDFDRYDVKPEYRAMLADVAAMGGTLTLEGNADERGSVEYNLVLGEKRAASVRAALVTMGMPANSINIISNGNLKPRLDCHDEICWQENRRVDVVR